MSELDGFVIYKPQKETKMHISVRRRGIGITRSAVDALGVPEYNYEPDNCRWISITEQAKNKRLNADMRGE